VRITYGNTAWVVVILAEERVPAVVVDHEALPAIDA